MPGSVRVIGEDELAAGRRAWIFEEVGGQAPAAVGESFFQASPEGAEVLVSLVGSAIAGAPDGPLVDAYGGVGLFAATLGEGRPVTLLECSPSAAADARVNLPAASVRLIDVAQVAGLKGGGRCCGPPTGRPWRCRGDRSGRQQGKPSRARCRATRPPLDGTRPCLRARGFSLEWAALVDMFPGTPHIEVVSRFVALVAVISRLVGAFYGHADVGGLVFR